MSFTDALRERSLFLTCADVLYALRPLVMRYTDGTGLLHVWLVRQDDPVAGKPNEWVEVTW